MLGSEQQARDGRCVLQRAARDLGTRDPSFVDVISWATAEKLGPAATQARWSAVFR